MNRATILIVEDCPLVRDALGDLLRRDYNVELAGNAEDALHILSQRTIDLIVMDLGLPTMDGNKLCAAVRAQDSTTQIPIIILSGRSDVEDKLMGFSLGANDYLQKPADMREIRARIQIQLKKNATKDSVPNSVLELAPFRLEILSQRISVSVNGKYESVSTSPLEFKLLHLLLTHPDQIFSREQMLDKVWGGTRYVNDRSVDVTISKLRQKLGAHGDLIEAVRGVGYRLCKTPSAEVKKAG